MRLTTVIEAVVILAAASVAFAGDLAEDSYRRAEVSVCEAADDVHGLDPRPWSPTYEQFRRAAIATLAAAEDSLTQSGNSLRDSRYWYGEYERYTAAGDYVRASGAAQRSQSAWLACVAQGQDAVIKSFGASECVRSAWAAIGK